MTGRGWAYLAHLRLNFQLMLAPVFLWGALAAGGFWSGRLAVAFVIIHLCLYGGATAFNSCYDRDESPVGGLKRPPPVPPGLLPYSLALQAVGASAALAVGPGFGAVYLAMFCLGVAYSHPAIRLKKHPWPSVLTVALGQGLLGFFAGYAAAGGPAAEVASLRMLEAAGIAALVTTTLYPLTQVYQIEADRERGDTTFAVAFGPRACFRFATAGAVLSGLLLGDYAWQYYSHAEAVALAAAAFGAAAYLHAWSGWFEPGDVEGNYERVMRLGYATSLCLGGWILWQLAG